MRKGKKRAFAAIIATMLAGTMVLSACSSGGPAPSGDSSKSSSESSKSESSNDAAESEYELTNGGDNTVDIGTPSKSLDPNEVYKTMTYTPEMFCNTYELIGSKEEVQTKATELGYYKYNEQAVGGGGIERKITVVPHRVQGRTYNYKDTKTGANIIYLLEARFFDDKGESTTKRFKFTIDQRTITMKEIKNIKYADGDYDTIQSFEEAQLELKYNFTFKGTTLKFEKDGKSLVMNTRILDAENDPKLYISTSGFLAKGSPIIDHIAGFSFTYQKDKFSSLYITFINDKYEDETANYCHGMMKEDGTFTFSIPYATETKTYQYVYILLERGLILTDGKVNYRYTEKEEDFKKYKLSAVLGDGANADDISAEKQKELTIAQNSILTDLEKAFAEKNIKVNIDKATGRVSLDSNILFAKDSSDLSDDGKKTLDDFLDVYTSVLLNDKNKNLVANIIVEGHTDTDGDHDYNQKLSEKRAETVAKYCTDKVPSLKNIIKSKGYSYDQPVLKDDGTIDMDASRRVVFKFTLDKK